VPAHGERLLLWQVTVPESSVARLTFRASPSSSSVQGDAVAVTLPVHPPLTAETVATSGQVFGSVQQPVAVPADALSKPGALTVEVTSALTDGLGRAWSSFTPTPYDSNEEIAARVLTGESLLSPSLTGLSARQVARIRAQLGADLARLTRRENPDGGWPWFTASGAASDPTITTDVVEALSAAGDPALRTPIRQGAQYLVQQLGRMAPAEAVHAALVVHGAGQATSGFSLNSVQRAHLDPAALADLARVSMLQGNRPAARSDIASLDAEVMVSATGAHWEGAGVVGPSSSAVRTTAEALRALVALAPRDPLLPDAARWLMLARQGAAWGCPCDSARAVAALAAYANAAHEGPAGYAYRVLVDGNEKLSGRYVRGRAPRAAFIRVPVAGLHRGGTSTLLVERSSVNSNLGPGPMYYVAGLQYFLRANAIKPLDRGVAVSRRYLSVSGQPISSAPAGSVVRVELTVRTGQTLTYLDLDDPIPAGVEPIDRSLNTSQQGLFKAELSAPGPGASDLSPYLTHVDIRDDRVSLYAVSLPPGTYTYSYLAQATVSGHYAVAPVRASEAFFPEVFGRGSGQVFDVK
jgi:uncharacterized protein YfaS (alpha-2-macroglobulin family)